MGKNKNKIVLKDKKNPNEKIVLSFVNGEFSIDKICKSEIKINILIQTKSNPLNQ